MRCPYWLLAVVITCAFSTDMGRECWEEASCKDLNSQDRILECILQCKSVNQKGSDSSSPSESSPSLEEEEEEESLNLGFLLSDLSPDDSFRTQSAAPGRGGERRSYSMEHFRWGKPMSRKRRPVKVYAVLEEEDEGGEGAPEEESKRRQLRSGEERGRGGAARPRLEKSRQEYRMGHFRWSTPPAKRYGGFMKPWVGTSQRPLLTLLRNTIMKEGH